MHESCQGELHFLVPDPRPSLIVDLRRLAKHAAGIGAAVALVCHFLPPQYHHVCDVLSQLCRLGE
jgi:hypothetical protein